MFTECLVVGEDPDIPTWSEVWNAKKPLVPAVKLILRGCVSI
jgi:hypothetical protein